MTIAMQSLYTDEEWAKIEAEVDKELAEAKRNKEAKNEQAK